MDLLFESELKLTKKYVAFLRGINLGKRRMKMDDVREVFADLQLSNVQTVIASGNVLFDAQTVPDVTKISAALLQNFGFEIGIVVRAIHALENLIVKAPFAAYDNDQNVKLYLSMAAHEIGDRLAGIKSVSGDFDVVLIKTHDFFTAAFPQPDGRYGAGLDKLDRLFKDNLLTTRNWNTIIKIVKKAQTT